MQHDVQAQMRTFDYFFGLRLGILLRHSDNLSTSLQVGNLCAAEKKHCQHARKIRSDEKFNLFWKDVENKAAIFDVDLPRLPERQLESRNAGKSAAPEFDDDVYLITEKYTTSNWIVSSMPSKIDSIWKIHQNIHKIRKSPSQSCKRKRPR